MKKRNFFLLLFLLLLLAAFSGCSENAATDSESGELELTLTANKENYKVTGIGTHKGTTVTIPETHEGKAVIYISDGAFENNREIKKVIIPKTVTQIYANAFNGCTSLAEVECHATGINMIATDAFRDTAFVKNLKNYEDGGLYISNNLIAVDPQKKDAFRIKDGTLTVAYQCFKNANISSLTVPDGCYHLGKFTFYEAKNLESVTFEASIGYLGEGLFYNCPSLRTVDISFGCVNINERVFFGCSSLETVRFPSNLSAIKDCAFSGCSSLKELVLPDSCKTIGKEAFLGCSSLQSVRGASSLESVGSKAFRDCTSLTVCNLPQGAIYGALAFGNTPLE